MARVVHSSWSFLVRTSHIPRRVVFSSSRRNISLRSFTPKRVNSWNSSIKIVTASATVNHALGVLPSPEVIGSHPTMMANIPILAQIRAKAPIFSRVFCSTEREGSMDQ